MPSASTTSCGNPTTRISPRPIRTRGSSSNAPLPACRRRTEENVVRQRPGVVSALAERMMAAKNAKGTKFRTGRFSTQNIKTHGLIVARHAATSCETFAFFMVKLIPMNSPNPHHQRRRSGHRTTDALDRAVVEVEIRRAHPAHRTRRRRRGPLDCRRPTVCAWTTADVGALLHDRVAAAKQWDDIPKAAYDPAARLKAMDEDGVGYSVLYPSLAGFSGERFGALTDPELALECVQAYNDWLIDGWASRQQAFHPPVHRTLVAHCRHRGGNPPSRQSRPPRRDLSGRAHAPRSSAAY